MKTILFTIAILIGASTYAQNSIMYKSVEACQKDVDQYGNFKEWTDWVPNEKLIMFDIDNKVIKVFFDKTLNYYIQTYNDSNINGDINGTSIMSFNCIDYSGCMCTVEMATNKNGYKFVTIIYKNYILMFQVIVLNASVDGKDI